MPRQVASGSTPPQTGSWTLRQNAYPTSIGYPGDCSVDSVNYDLRGSSHSWFDATVGVDDAADTTDQQTPVGFTVIVSPGNTQFNTTAYWDKPKQIHLPIHGATMLTLETTTSVGVDCLFSSAVAVWGNARLVP